MNPIDLLAVMLRGYAADLGLEVDEDGIAKARAYCDETVPLPHCPFCGKVHVGPLPCRHCSEPDMPDQDDE
jgi:hypothetical protein